MKKIFAICMSIGALLLSSCSSEEPVLTTENDGNVVFTATLPAQMVQSRSVYDDGLTATNLDYAVYDEEGNNIAALNGTGTFTNRQTTVSLSLVSGKTYTVVFWASAPTSPYEFNKSTGIVSVDVNGNANDANRDAFFAYEKFTVTGAINKTVELKRPFAQINIGTSDLAAFTAAGGSISTSGITVTAPNKLDLRDGSVTGEEAYTFTPAAFIAETEEFPIATTPTQRWLATAFVLTEANKTTLDITWTSDNTTPDRNAVIFTYVPVQRNFRTNIYGTLLTNPAEYNVIINQEFEKPDHDYIVNNAICTWDANNIVCISPALPSGMTAEDFTTNNAGVACIASNGEAKYFPATSSGLADAMSISDEIFLAPNSEITMKSHEAKIPSTGVKIYGNGAKISGQESDFALDYTTFVEGSNVNIYIENLNNARVWGDSKVACTLNVTLKDCTFIGGGYGNTGYSLGLIMMRGKSLATHNITLENCYCEGVQVGIHSANAGTFKFNNCTFNNVGIPINIAKKNSADSKVSVIGCNFIDCGLEENGSDSAWNYAAPIRIVDNQGPENSMAVEISNTSITGRKGQYDVLLTDYRENKTTFKVSYTISNSGELVVND